MAPTSPDTAEPQAAAQRDARIAVQTDALCLKHMLNVGRQSYILMPSVFFIAYLAVLEGAVMWAAVWFVAWIGRMVYVFRLVGRLRANPDVPPGPALNEVAVANFIAGVVAGGLVPVFFARSNDMVLLIVTFLITTYAGTMMIAASGVLRAGLSYGIPTIGVLIVGWLWHGAALGYGLAGFLALTFSLSVVAIRAQRLALTEVVRVIDDNVTLSKALAHERDRAESASQSKTRFFAAASHDLRQPLHALSINATTLDLVARRSGDGLLKELSQGIGSALNQSRGLLDGLLDISRLDAHAVQTRMAPHDMAALLEAVREEYAALATQRGLALEVDVGVGADAPWALTDADQLLRILGNLVDNAIKFTREGGVVLSAQKAPAGRVLVRVSDTGPGIAVDERERVFEEFYQVGNPSRDRSQGLGLGLAIVKRTAALLDASLQLICEPDCGATFELSLPAAASGVPQPAPAADVSSGTALSVLLVDDEPDVLTSLCRYLRQIGWVARGVASGDEAEQAVAQGFRADVLVVDFRLRDETGLDVIARLRRQRADLPVVIVTGDTEASRLREFALLRASVLHKPVGGDRLARALVEAVVRTPAQQCSGFAGTTQA